MLICEEYKFYSLKKISFILEISSWWILPNSYSSSYMEYWWGWGTWWCHGIPCLLRTGLSPAPDKGPEGYCRNSPLAPSSISLSILCDLTYCYWVVSPELRPMSNFYKIKNFPNHYSGCCLSPILEGILVSGRELNRRHLHCLLTQKFSHSMDE